MHVHNNQLTRRKSLKKIGNRGVQKALRECETALNSLFGQGHGYGHDRGHGHLPWVIEPFPNPGVLSMSRYTDTVNVDFIFGIFFLLLLDFCFVGRFFVVGRFAKVFHASQAGQKIIG